MLGENAFLTAGTGLELVHLFSREEVNTKQ